MPAGAALGDLHAAAVNQGKFWRLDCADGTWMCAGCRSECPFHVSLHCDWCRDEHARKRRDAQERDRLRSPEDRRWEAIALNVAKDSRLDEEGAQRLIEKARKLPSYTSERLAVLNMAYERRFAPREVGSTYAARSAPVEDPAEIWERD